jgi:hypothetical protein
VHARVHVQNDASNMEVSTASMCTPHVHVHARVLFQNNASNMEEGKRKVTLLGIEEFKNHEFRFFFWIFGVHFEVIASNIVLEKNFKFKTIRDDGKYK